MLHESDHSSSQSASFPTSHSIYCRQPHQAAQSQPCQPHTLHKVIIKVIKVIVLRLFPQCPGMSMILLNVACALHPPHFTSTFPPSKQSLKPWNWTESFTLLRNFCQLPLAEVTTPSFVLCCARISHDPKQQWPGNSPQMRWETDSYSLCKAGMGTE